MIICKGGPLYDTAVILCKGVHKRSGGSIICHCNDNM